MGRFLLVQHEGDAEEKPREKENDEPKDEEQQQQRANTEDACRQACNTCRDHDGGKDGERELSAGKGFQGF